MRSYTFKQLLYCQSMHSHRRSSESLCIHSTLVQIDILSKRWRNLESRVLEPLRRCKLDACSETHRTRITNVFLETTALQKQVCIRVCDFVTILVLIYAIKSVQNELFVFMIFSKQWWLPCLHRTQPLAFTLLACANFLHA